MPPPNRYPRKNQNALAAIMARIRFLKSEWYLTAKIRAATASTMAAARETLSRFSLDRLSMSAPVDENWKKAENEAAIKDPATKASISQLTHLDLSDRPQLTQYLSLSRTRLWQPLQIICA